MEILKSLSPWTWAYLGTITIVLVAMTALVILDYRQEKKFRKKYGGDNGSF